MPFDPTCPDCRRARNQAAIRSMGKPFVTEPCVKHKDSPRPVYVAAEPETKTVYIDQKGATHYTREAAIRSNFRCDLNEAFEACAEEVEGTIQSGANLIELMAKRHPDMLRIVLGDRDET